MGQSKAGMSSLWMGFECVHERVAEDGGRVTDVAVTVFTYGRLAL